MELIVDLHIHSHYSRATSPDCTLEGLYRWGKIKGINIIGTGDFTHPLWFAELKEKLEKMALATIVGNLIFCWHGYKKKWLLKVGKLKKPVKRLN